MFQTHRSAIFPLQNESNIILWNWVELAVDAPFFMLELESKAEEGAFVTRRMTSNINQGRRTRMTFPPPHLSRQAVDVQRLAPSACKQRLYGVYSRLLNRRYVRCRSESDGMTE